ncbi:hypothetical protein QE152_g16963 [Popillia japonica]|uniref:Uncharacterized protein n=1 Tax=Popillia japonica TaxID=7064 RepID=A0AAW1L5R7_POPJA
MKAATTSTGESTKLQRKYRGPLTITKVLPGDTYGVADLRNDLGKRYITTAHVSQLKVWKTNTEDEKSDEEINASDEKPDVSDKEVETERQRCSIRKRSVCEKDRQRSRNRETKM